jgi:uncharacterized membrane protein
MPSFLHSPVSVVHLLAVLVALATGTAVLLKPKGTLYHRRLGWAYAGSMSISLLTAFQIYFLFGRFGVVHWGAVASVAALLLGTGAAVFRSVVANWLRWHYFGMGASVTGASGRKHIPIFSGHVLLVEHHGPSQHHICGGRLVAAPPLPHLGHLASCARSFNPSAVGPLCGQE